MIRHVHHHGHISGSHQRIQESGEVGRLGSRTARSGNAIHNVFHRLRGIHPQEMTDNKPGIRERSVKQGTQNNSGPVSEFELNNNKRTIGEQKKDVPSSLLPKPEYAFAPQHDKLKNEDVISLCKQGREIYRDIMSGAQIAPTKDNVVKVMWYLQVRASNKVSSSAGLVYEGPQIFKMGAFSVEDNEHYLETFLNKAGSYNRKSSHLMEYQKAGAEYQPRGLDILSKDGHLPHGRKTILFERMPQKSRAVPTGIPGKNMLFIKMEEHGCYRNRDKIAHLGDFIPTLLEQRLGRVKTDTGTDNRERIPAVLKKQYSDILSRYELVTGTKFSSSDAMSTTGGVKTMIDDLLQMHNDISFNINGRAFAGDITHILADIKSMSDTLRARDHAELRIGNEIILTSAPPDPVTSPPGSWTTGGSNHAGSDWLTPHYKGYE
ncbi:TPA: hypothetical protein ACODKK_003781 [Salmonella enterica subsp. enterica serovar Freetown]